MKIIRYQDPSNAIHYGVERPDGTRVEMSGDPFGTYSATDRPAQVRKLLAPIVPTAFLCIGLNYRRHAEEGKQEIPKYPVLFMKSPGAVQNPGDPIQLPRHLASNSVDYECELAVVISKRCKNVTKAQALEYV